MDLCRQVARDLALAPREVEAVEESARVIDRQRGQRSDRSPAEPHAERLGVESLSVAARTGRGFAFEPFVPPDFLAGLLLVEALDRHARAEAVDAPAVLRVVREQARIGLGEASAARRTGAARREYAHAAAVEHVQDALTEVECALDVLAQFPLGLRRDDEFADRQLDRVFAEPVEPRPLARRQVFAVDPQPVVALRRRPLREIGVVALAGHDQRRQQCDAPATRFALQPRHDRVGALRLDRHVAVGTVLRAELHVQQPQEVMHFGQRPDRALAAAATGALLDGDGRRDAEDRVDVRPPRGLHELARVGVQRLEVATLPLGEDYVERKRGLPRARDAGQYRHAVTRNRHVHVTEIVLPGPVYDDRIARRHPGLRRAVSSASLAVPRDPCAAPGSVPARTRRALARYASRRAA